MQFEYPQLLYLAPLVDALLLGLYFWARRARLKSAISYAPVKVLKSELGPRGLKRPRTILLLAIYLAMLTLVMMALANPYSLERRMKKYAIGVIVLDISGSMEARDMGFNRTRLEAAKDALYGLLNNLEVGQFELGVIAFSGVPYPVASLTSDAEELKVAIASLTVVWSSTNIGDSLMGAFNWLNSSGAKNGFVVLMTDGVWFTGADPAVVADHIAQSSDIRVYSVAIGGEGAFVNGHFVEPPDVAGLVGISHATGGSVYTAENYLDLIDVISNEIPQDAGIFELQEESKYYLFLIPVPPLLLLYVIASERRFGLLP